MYGVNWDSGEVVEEPSIFEVFLLFFRVLHGENKRIGSSLADLVVAVFCFFALVAFSTLITCLGYSEHDTCGIVDKVDNTLPFVRGWLSNISTLQQSEQPNGPASLPQHVLVKRPPQTVHTGTQTDLTVHSYSLLVQSQNSERCTDWDTVPTTTDIGTIHASVAGEAIGAPSAEAVAATELHNISLKPCSTCLKSI